MNNSVYVVIDPKFIMALPFNAGEDSPDAEISLLPIHSLQDNHELATKLLITGHDLSEGELDELVEAMRLDDFTRDSVVRAVSVCLKDLRSRNA